MASTVEISVQNTTDPNVKAYHTHFELSDRIELGARGSSEEMSEFGRLVLGIRGIAQVYLGPYVLVITKAPLFDWSEIDPPIQSILSTFAISQRQIEDAHGDPTLLVVDRVKGRKMLSSRAVREGRETA